MLDFHQLGLPGHVFVYSWLASLPTFTPAFANSHGYVTNNCTALFPNSCSKHLGNHPPRIDYSIKKRSKFENMRSDGHILHPA